MAHPPAHMNCIKYIRGGVVIHFTYLTQERYMRSFVRGSSTTFLGRRYGTEDLMLPHVRVSSRREYDSDGSSDDGPLSGVQFMEFSRFSRRSRGGVSGFTVIFLDRHGRFWEYDEVVGRHSVRTGETQR
ncbi:hypothetical protein EVAR_38545_1 [Eumeta japonica]|uniref:Uncharacterized protein n=1 Tax=Eumeta variegata TaxID=151549 RepID=A0A4C1WCE2_EUMVA|nr:hypothetical protein EVAR_38545_1 [Eumeta japonica]